MVQKKANSTSDRTTTTDLGDLEYPVPPPGLCYCLCGCGELMFIIDEWGREPGYINGHQSRGSNNGMYGRIGTDSPVYKDMSNRICSVCGKNNTRIIKPNKTNGRKTERPFWIKDKCIICYNRIQYQTDPNLRQRKKEYRMQNREKRKEYMREWYKKLMKDPVLREKERIRNRERTRRKLNIPPERYRV